MLGNNVKVINQNESVNLFVKQLLISTEYNIDSLSILLGINRKKLLNNSFLSSFDVNKIKALKQAVFNR